MSKSGRRIQLDPQVQKFDLKEYQLKKKDKGSKVIGAKQKLNSKNFQFFQYEIKRNQPIISQIYKQKYQEKQDQVEPSNSLNMKSISYSQQSQPISKVFKNVKLMEQEYYVQEFILIKLGILQNFVNTCESSAVIMHFQTVVQKNRVEANTKITSAQKSLAIRYTTQVFYFSEADNNISSQEYFKLEQELFIQLTNDLHKFLIETLKQMSISMKLNQTSKQVVKKMNDLRRMQTQKKKKRLEGVEDKKVQIQDQNISNQIKDNQINNPKEENLQQY